VRKLKEIHATHYLYAPKEDPFHRREWHKPYPTAWQQEFQGFVGASRRLKIGVVPGLAPGLSFRYQSKEDFEALVRKLQNFAALGCEEVALLMDDISAELPEADAEAFHSLGEAHGFLLQQLWKRLSAKGTRGIKGKIRRLWFCPTVYCDAFSPEGAQGNLSRDPYLRDLAKALPDEVEVMWTGPAIISRRLAASDLRGINRVLGRSTVLWDNLYANDYCPGKIFLGPFRDRSSSLKSVSAGLLLNPTGLYQTDLFLLDVLGGFLKGESAQSSWKKALVRHQVPSGFLKIAPFLSSPFGFKVPSSKSVAVLRKALKPLIWDWKSPLQREWYPYLYALDADLRLLTLATLKTKGKDKPDAAWVRKKYSPFVAGLLLEHRDP
jgi:hypothetical protein